MLQLLHIENIAVIERADIELDKGLTVLSGETGAGKSIVIDSIGALLGKRVAAIGALGCAEGLCQRGVHRSAACSARTA